MAGLMDVFIDGLVSHRSVSSFGTGTVDSYLDLIHFHKFNQFLLTKFVCLYRIEIDTVSLQLHHLVPG